MANKINVSTEAVAQSSEPHKERRACENLTQAGSQI